MTDLNSEGVNSTTDLQPSESTKHLAYAEAAVMLIECLLLVLVEQRVLTTQQAVAAVESAMATKRQMADEGEHARISAVAAGVLSTMANSLAADEIKRPR
jgi:hypothetical protein